MCSNSKRTFDIPRLKSFAGYAERPVVQDTLSYFIPPFSVVSSRLVAFRNQLFEIWSPNSAQMPFYPGVRDFTVRLTISLHPSQRRCDGHMGRFDPTISPQHHNPKCPWLPFIRRLSDGSHPEHQAFLTVWRPTSSSNRGIIDPHYLQQLASRSQLLLDCIANHAAIEGFRPAVWEDRPTGPSPQDIGHVLGGERTFDHAVDVLSRVQTDLKIMSAWIRMAHLVIQGSHSNSSPTTSIPNADDSMVGIWLNGTTEEVGLWLLQHSVPCFIIHEVEKPADLRRVMQNFDRLPNFWQNTPVASLCFDVNPVDVAVSRDRGILHDLETDIGLATQAPEADSRSRDRSSPHAQGFVDGCYQDPRVPTPSRFAPLEITVVNGMIIPPPVALVTQGKQWSKWIWETNSEGEECLSRVGKHNEEGGDFKYYDREKCRFLFLDERLEAPEHYFADPAVYGLPAPRVRYYEQGNNEVYERAGSHWVYLQKEPKRENIGREYTPPASTPAPIPPRNTMGDDELDWSDSPILYPVPSNEMEVVPSLSLQPSSPRFRRSPPRSRSSSSRLRSRSPPRRNRAPPPSFPRSCFPYARVHLSSPPRRPRSRSRSRSPYMPPRHRRSSPRRYSSRRHSPRRHFPSHQQFRPLPREEWRVDGSEDSSPVAGPSRPGGMSNRSVPVVTEPFSGGPFTSLSRVTVDSSEQWEMDVSEEPSVGGPSRSGGGNDGSREGDNRIIMSSVPSERLSSGPSLQGMACLAETLSTAANLAPDTESWGMDVTEGPALRIAPFGGINDKIAESSVADAIEPLSAPSLPLTARLSEAPSIAANPPVGKESRRMDTTALSIVPFGGIDDKIAKSNVVGAIEPLSAGPSLPLVARLSTAPSIAANPPVDKERMLALFPVPTSTDISLNSVISASSQSRFLVMWNLPGHFVWRDVVTWLERCIAYLEKPQPVLERVARTNQRGDQAFWLKFTTMLGASAFRGLVAGRQAADTPIIQCDYVDGNEYSGALSRSSDSWTPKGGFMGNVSPTAPFPTPSVTEMKAPPLADRLAPYHRRTHRGKKKKVKMSEDMQT